jgi:hypothetical protein
LLKSDSVEVRTGIEELSLEELGSKMTARALLRRQQPQMRTYYATMLVTRVEQWWVEAASAEEAQELFTSGQGHNASMGERVHIELGMMSEDAA